MLTDGPEEEVYKPGGEGVVSRAFTEQQAFVEMVLMAAGGVGANSGIFFLIKNLNVFTWQGWNNDLQSRVAILR